MEMQFYMKECIKEGWKVRELKRSSRMKFVNLTITLPLVLF